MFEQASRLKLRFAFKGQQSAEDLWDLSVQDLDSIYKALKAESNAAKEESLLSTKSSTDTIVDLKIQIVKHIVETKLAEKSAREVKQANAAQKQKILAIIAEKQDGDLRSMSLEDLKKIAESL